MMLYFSVFFGTGWTCFLFWKIVLFFATKNPGDSMINRCFFEILLWILWGSVYVPYC